MNTMTKSEELNACVKFVEGIDKETASNLIGCILAIHGYLYAYNEDDKYLGKVTMSHYKAGVIVLKIRKDTKE